MRSSGSLASWSRRRCRLVDQPQANAPKKPLFDEAFLRRLESLSILFQSAARSQLQGERRSSRRGQSVEFSDFRPYALGDDFRRIDWNAYARLERLFLKLYVEEEDIILHILIDNSPSMDWGEPNKLRFATQAAAAAGYIALAGLDRVTVSSIYPSASGAPGFFPPVRGKNSAMRLFSFIENLSSCAAGQVDGSRINTLVSGITQPGAIIVFSDLMDDAWQPGLNRLMGHGHHISLLHILSPDELSPALSGDFRLTDQENGATVEVTADFETLQKYQFRLQDWQASWRKYCTARQITYLPISTDLPLEDLLFARLPTSGVLR